MSDLDTGKNFTQGSFSGAVNMFVNLNSENGYDAVDDNGDDDNGHGNGNGAAYGDQTWRRPSCDSGSNGCTALCIPWPDMQTLALVALKQSIAMVAKLRFNGCIVQSQKPRHAVSQKIQKCNTISAALLL